jgi:hypothetical protein
MLAIPVVVLWGAKWPLFRWCADVVMEIERPSSSWSLLIPGVIHWQGYLHVLRNAFVLLLEMRRVGLFVGEQLD